MTILIVKVSDANFYQDGWSVSALDPEAVERHNKIFGTNFICGQLSKAERIFLNIQSKNTHVSINTEYVIQNNWLLETLMKGFYGSLVNNNPFSSNIHNDVKKAIENELSKIDFDTAREFEIKITL